MHPHHFIASLAMGLALVAAGGCATTLPACEPTGLAYVGTENGRIHALRFDACAGRMTALGEMAHAPKPRWFVAHPALPVLYAATDGDGKEGSVVAFQLDRETGALSKVSEVAAGGGGTTHLWLDTPSMTLLAANFGGGSTSSLAIKGDGSLGALVSTIKATGSGPHRRQASPHAHGVAVDPSGRYTLVADMGSDRLLVYGFDRATRALAPDIATAPRSLVVPPGSGPRHFAFDKTGGLLYLLNELTADVMALRWDQRSGRLTLLQSLPTSSPGMREAPSASEIALSRDGRFVYVANRGEDALLVYRVAADSGALSPVQRLSSGGKSPWAFQLHATGRWLLVANFRSNDVKLFSVDVGSGMLSDTGQSIELPAPWSVAFLN